MKLQVTRLVDDGLSLTEEKERRLLEHVKNLLTFYYLNHEFKQRLESVDIAYYNSVTKVLDCCETQEERDDVLKSIGVPLIKSQVQTAIGYLAETYLTEYPLFPVIGDNEKLSYELIENIEALIEEHSIKGKWKKQLIRLFSDLSKYNHGSIELCWGPIYDAEAVQLASTGVLPDPGLQYINKLYTPNIYNSLWDIRTDPSEASEKGEFAGYQEIITRSELLKLMTQYSVEGNLLHGEEIFNWLDWEHDLYWDRPILHPEVSSLESKRVNWFAWSQGKNIYTKDLDSDQQGKKNRIRDLNRLFLRTKMYVRLDPDDFGLAPNDLNQSIYLIEVINHKYVIKIEKQIVYFDLLPMYIGQYYDDSMGVQTKSIAEEIMPIQRASEDLINSNVGLAKRAVGDRLLYDASSVDESDMSSRDPTARIPVRLGKSSIPGAKLSDVVSPMPFNDTASATVLQSLQTIFGFPEQFTGLNSATEGRFRKGNRTLGEFNTIMGNVDARQTPTLMLFDSQFFSPIKHQIRFNIVRFAPNQDQGFVSSGLQRQVEISATDLRESMNSVKLADGLQPRNVVGNTEVVAGIFDAISKIPLLQEEFDLVKVFSYLSSLSGVHNLNKYKRKDLGGENVGQPAGNISQLPANRAR